MKQPFFKQALFLLLAFLVFGISYTLFAWKLDASYFLLNISFYQTESFLTGLPDPQSGLIWADYNPLKDVPAFLLAKVFNHHLILLWITLGLLAGGTLWGYYNSYRPLFSNKQKNYACLLITLLLAALPAFYEQLGTLNALWIPFGFLLGATSLLLRKNASISVFVAGILLGFSMGLSIPFAIAVLGGGIFVATEKDFKKICLFLIGSGIGGFVAFLPWGMALLKEGYSIPWVSLIKAIHLPSFSSYLKDQLVNFICFLTPFLGVWVFRPKGKNYVALLYRYSLAVSIMWLFGCSISLFVSRGKIFFIHSDLFFILQSASLPIWGGLATQLKNKNFSFVSGLILGLFFCFWPHTPHRMEMNHFMEVKLPFNPNPKDVIIIQERINSFILSYLPKEISIVNVKAVPNYYPTSKVENLYLITSKPFHREELKNPILSRYSSRNTTLPKLELEKLSLHAKTCRPILTNRSTFQGFNPMMCLLEKF